GWASTDVLPIRPLSVLLTGLNIYTGGPAGKLEFAMSGTAFNSRNIKVKYNNTYIHEQPMSYMSYVKKTIENIPQSLNVHSDYVRFYFESTSPVSTDRSVVSNFVFTYPSRWNFNNQNEFSFEMPASATEKLIEIVNFNSGNVAPVLLDLTSLKRYKGDISTVPGKIRFMLPPAGVSQKYQLLNVSNSIGSEVTKVQKKTFVNFEDVGNQGDYLIISNKALFSGSDGKNYVDLYKQYRESAAGGNYRVQIVDIDELVDQFAYGIKKHPSSIKDFIQYAASTFTLKPNFVFLVGKGVTYDEYLLRQSSLFSEKLNLVPTFGYPASDVLLSAPYGSGVPTVPIGSLSVVNGDEVGNYLRKMIEYEARHNSPVQTLENKLPLKNIIQIVGSNDLSESNTFTAYMNDYKSILKDTSYGANVDLFVKTSNSSVQLLSSQKIEQYFKDGINLISYFGHSSANTLGFNLSSPTSYDNPGKYPFFMVSGCTAGNNYIMDSTRYLENKMTISEDFVLTPNRGSIGFFASSHYGLPPQLHYYNKSFFNDAVRINYGLTIGELQRNTIQKVGGNNPTQDFFTRADYEEMTLHGDPALRLSTQAKPDYIIEDQLIKVNPTFISVSESHFEIDAKAYNIGKAVKDSISFRVQRTYPNGITETILNKRIRGINYQDSIRIQVPIISTRDKGLNKMIITIDADNEVDELSEGNNSITKEVYIYEDEARPAYPGEFAIVNNSAQKLFASTADPFSPTKAYVMEIDTTQLFNSPIKRTSEINSIGGVLEFEPGLSYQDNSVYYWRVAVKPLSGLPQDYHWNKSSFIYLANSSLGANQSHFYQHLASDTQNIKLT
ncbi:MAG: C25 family cysteine peptidase, partial [Ginsengibacter sp.]